MGALYPKPKERYDRWRLNENSPLYSSTVFLFIASPHLVTGSRVRESGPFNLVAVPENCVPDIVYRADIGRYAIYLPGASRQKVWFTSPPSRLISTDLQISMTVTWRYDDDRQDLYARVAGVMNNYYVQRSQISGSWSITSCHQNGTYQYRSTIPISSFPDYWNYTGAIFALNDYAFLLNNFVAASVFEGSNVDTKPFYAFIGSTEYGDYGPLKGWVADVAIFKTRLSRIEIYMLTEPDNHDYRIGGVPLLLPERPRFWAVNPYAESAIRKTPWHLLVQGAV